MSTLAESRCSFCGKRQDQVQKLIAGPRDVFICNECIRLCNEILDEEWLLPSPVTKRDPEPSKPRWRWPWRLAWGVTRTLVAVGDMPLREPWRPPR